MNFFKRAVAFSVSVVFAFSGGSNVIAADTSLVFEGALVQLETASVLVNGTTLVGMREIFELLGAEVLWDGSEQKITATKDNMKISLTIGSLMAKVNDRYVRLPVAPLIKDGTTMVPVRFVSDSLGYDVFWDNSNKVISVSKSTKNLHELPQNEIEQTYYSDDLTFEEAFDKAIASNSDLKTLAANIDLINKNRKSLYDEMTVFASDYPQIYDNQSVSMILQLIQYDTSRSNAPLTESILKTATEFSIYNSFSTIKSYELDIDLLKNKIELDKINFKNLELQLSLGMQSQINVDKARIALEQSSKNLEILEKTLELEFIGLNNLMGIKGSYGYNIDFQPEYTTITIKDMDKYINDAINNDPNIKMQEQAIKNAFISLNAFSVNPSDPVTSSYDYKKNVYDSEKRTLEDMKLSLDKTIRSYYNNIKKLEDTIASQELDIKKAKEDYDVVLIQYDTGFATEYQTQLANFSIKNAEVTLSKSILNYNSLKFILENPFMGKNG